MTDFQPADPQWEARVRASFDRLGIMKTLGARLGKIAPGSVEILLEYNEGLSQQHGYFHAGVTSTIADSAGGLSAYSLFPVGRAALSVEFKINMLNPADGDCLRAVGKVLKLGRTLSICEIEVYSQRQERESLCAKMQQTLFQVAART
ncbi:PaaI family thioesterase [Fodinicurvata sediminis]|uniref:PaaI family thioesterase n=1 Tax=Fodinicurvata sediminis TaxID=1121832 RepID=UPI0003B5B5E3|nr:PaaI family thioesterase [Fodinicurvata sediminis]